MQIAYLWGFQKKLYGMQFYNYNVGFFKDLSQHA